MSLDQLAVELHSTAASKGFWNHEVDIHFVLSKLALVHSEVSEVLEAVRKEKGSDEIVEEMADIIIRLLDLYQGMMNSDWINTSLDDALYRKSAVNTARARLHGNLA